MDIINMLKKMMKLVMIEEDVKKYVDDASYILEMFNKIEEYYKYARELSPLYHPISYEVELRKDIKSEFRVDLDKFAKVDKEGFVEAPPIRGKKMFR